MASTNSDESVSGGGCPVKQTVPLSTARQCSTIPKGEVTPQHQPEGANVWVYPSEQQYFNAMKRKGWEAQEQDVPIVLAIHNAVNEQGWSKVREWEAMRGGDPKLKEFRGRPNDISPKAWFKTNVLGYKPPFDRHDWVVESAGREVRYVIDFYAGKGTPERPVALHLDVRPALDSADAALHRACMFAKEELRLGVERVPTLGGLAAAAARDGGQPPDDRPPPAR
ncbi:cytochrome c/c1 heme lyase-domain-containing protein [Tribonema minus]|uniref:Holocytochrome c-type synthase n=1 Tax=Tribonema minus TaxID=303371 RepID=A0A835ZPE3_9STRA|nr:cytochrome c/c1 heme lyase-domain-containing protein [Tribonema minus]